MNPFKRPMAIQAANLLSYAESYEKAMAKGLPTGKDAALVSPQSAEAGLDTGAEKYQVIDGVAIIPIHGVILRNPDFWTRLIFGDNLTDVDVIAPMIAEASDNPNIAAILLDVSSPGGQVGPGEDLRAAVEAAAESLPVAAYVTDYAASGALWAMCPAHRIFAGPAAMVGSIGVYEVIVDSSAAAQKAGQKVHVVSSGGIKGGRVDGLEISPEVLSTTQDRVNKLRDMFVQIVATHRGLPVDKVMAIATGDYWIGEDAKEKGLIDAVGDIADAMAYLDDRSFYGGSTMPNAGNHTMTPAALEEKFPDAVATIRTEAAKAAVEKATTQAQDGERARFDALATAFPNHPDFVATAFKAGDSVDEAKAKFNDVLAADLNAKNTEIENLKQQLSLAGTPLDAKKEDLNVPPPTGKANAGNDDKETFMDKAKAYAAENKCSMGEAVKACHGLYPELHAQMRQG